jgi:transcriptional regulator with XRE-family HTH domain
MIFAVLRAIRDKTPTEVAKKTFVSPSTIAKWRKPLSEGGTRYPQHATLAAVARDGGLEFQLVPIMKEEPNTKRRRNGAHNYLTT